jgi:hypothetical protein
LFILQVLFCFLSILYKHLTCIKYMDHTATVFITCLGST